MGGPGGGRRMRGGAGGVGTAARGAKHEMSRQESPFSPPCQLISVCCLQLNKACTTFLFRLLPPALTVPSNFQQFVLLLTPHASTSLPTLLMKGKCDRLSALLCLHPPYQFDPHLTRLFANLAVTRHKCGWEGGEKLSRVAFAFSKLDRTTKRLFSFFLLLFLLFFWGWGVV